MDLARITQALDTYVRPTTPAIAVRMLDSTDEIPERAKMPLRDFKVKMPLCQGLALARRHGLVMAMSEGDMNCPLGALAMGFLPAKEGYLDGRFGIPFWGSSDKAIAKLAQGMPRLEYGRHSHVVAAPLERTAFEPHVLIVYGDPARIGRMIQAVVYVTGEPVVSSSTGGAACAQQIAQTLLTGTCQPVIAGGGERVFALTQDHEASLTLPAGMADAFADALEETHKRGVRYPTRSYLTFGGSMPPNFEQLMAYLEEGE